VPFLCFSQAYIAIAHHALQLRLESVLDARATFNCDSLGWLLPEFHQLRGRCAIRDSHSIGVAASSKPAAVFAFDLLQLRGKDLRALPLLKRKAALAKALKRTQRIVYCKHLGESGEKLFQAADQLGLEGVIGKRADSPYVRGRTANWVKVKTSHGRHLDEERAKWYE
jgi:ATP-dependent DNA ligase